MTVEAGIVIAQLLLKYGPEVAAGVSKILSGPTHTMADWNAVFEQVKTSEQMIAEAKQRAVLPIALPPHQA